MTRKNPSSSPRRALLSVSDKSGIREFASVLHDAGFQILSTGGTQRALVEAEIPVMGVEHITQFPECFGGRVKTLHPLIAGGILFKRDGGEQENEARTLGIAPIDIVVVNLYPFEEGYRKAGSVDGPVAHADLIELIDIGGPTLLRSAAKNHESVTVVCDPADYERVAEQLKSFGTTTPEFRRELAAKVFTHTAAYDALVAEFLSDGTSGGVVFEDGRTLRYGENPHQWGRFYEIHSSEIPAVSVGNSEVGSGEWLVDSKNRESATTHCSLPTTHWSQLHGKPLSYLNILDADAAWRMATDFDRPTAVLVKHANPSGIASHDDIAEAFQRAYDADRLSAFGVIIALNRPCTATVARKIIDQKIFTEVILAPAFDVDALEMLKQKPNMRILDMDGMRLEDTPVYRSALGGMLVQNEDKRTIVAADLKCVTKKQPTTHQIEDLLFAWKVVKHAKSNAIVFAKRQTTVGIGCGQTSRVDSSWIAAKRAGVEAQDAVMASDAFFPFPDALEEAAKHGIAAVIQPGGSIRDAEVFKRADELGLAMVVTGVRGFRH